jgi:hypothetical protein
MTRRCRLQLAQNRYRFALMLAAALLASPATAQSNCAPHAVIMESLADRYGESRVGIGMGADGAVVEVWAGHSGSWTITVTAPGALTCLVASGQGYEAIPLPAPGVDG